MGVKPGLILREIYKLRVFENIRTEEKGRGGGRRELRCNMRNNTNSSPNIIRLIKTRENDMWHAARREAKRNV
jgi:hypothetical protein